MHSFSELSLIFWVVLVLILLIQGSWIFNDASKRGENKWVWGILGLLNVPSSLLIYLLVTRYIMKTVDCKKCGNKVRPGANYCSNCGEKIIKE